MVSVKWIATERNLADIFTKPVSRQVLNKLLDKTLGVCLLEESDINHLI